MNTSKRRSTNEAPGIHNATPATDGSSAPAGTIHETGNYLETYKIIADWIRFADAKAAVALTAGGAMAGLLIPTLRPFLKSANTSPAWVVAIVGVLFAAWFVTWGVSCIWAFLCIIPLRRRGRHLAFDRCTHFHPAAISEKYSLDELDAFVVHCKDMGLSGLKDEVMAGVLIDAHISRAKYDRVTTSIKWLAASAVPGVFYTLITQLPLAN